MWYLYLYIQLSYVIQNFYDSNKKINLTPRFKFFFLLNNLEKFFIFIKINTFLKFTNKLNFNCLNNFNLFFKYFFSKQFIKFLLQLNLNLVGNYNNNLIKSSAYNIFYLFDKFLDLKKINYNNFLSFKKINYNLYFLPIKTLNIRINNNYYRNIFFFFMLINPFM